YLDEAERCHRVALMHEGVFQQVGTPTELRDSVGAKRLEVQAENLAEAETVLAEAAGSQQEILDVQRFGDRLDLLVREPEEGKRILKAKLSSAGIPVGGVLEDEPTLENAFVAKLRSLGQTVHETPFPGRHSHENLRDQVAIGATSLTRHFGEFTAVKNVNLQVRYGEIYGLLDANGAGKTTTIKMLCGLLDPSQGEVQLAGERDPRAGSVRQRVSYMSQKFSLYDDLSIADNLDFFAGVYGVPPNERS